LKFRLFFDARTTSSQGTYDQVMADYLGPKTINLGVAKLGNSSAKAGPMGEAIASPKAPTFGGSYLRSAP